MIDFWASAPHYRDHLSAVRDALPEAVRGDYVADLMATDNPVLVAAFGDLQTAAEHGRTRIAIMEHGAGQSYGGRGGVQHGSYAGGQGRGGASLFLHPGPHPAARDRTAYPAARVEVVGAPHLDTLPSRTGPKGRVVAFSFHFNGPLYPETRNAYPYFMPAIARLASRFELLGHGHPKLWAMGSPGRKLADRYRMLGIEPVESFAEVCRRADVYVCDNSSTLFSFASTGRPVVVLNSPRYDRRVNHGLRFWEAAGVGVNCNDPDQLADCIDEALEDSPDQQAKREEALDLVYAYRSGAGQRAADVLQDWAAA